MSRVGQRVHRSALFCSHLFPSILAVPSFQNLACGFGLYIAEDMGMAENKFLTKTVAYVFHIEITGFGAYLCIKSHMQQHIAQLFADVILVIAYQASQSS